MAKRTRKPPVSGTDFMSVAELSGRTGIRAKTFYNAHCNGVGPLAEILTKLGGNLGAWRADYDQFVSKRRKLNGKRAEGKSVTQGETK